jgi:hypothetical protein
LTTLAWLIFSGIPAEVTLLYEGVDEIDSGKIAADSIGGRPGPDGAPNRPQAYQPAPQNHRLSRSYAKLCHS